MPECDAFRHTHHMPSPKESVSRVVKGPFWTANPHECWLNADVSANVSFHAVQPESLKPSAVDRPFSFLDPEDLSKRNEIGKVLTALSSVRHMIISKQTLKTLHLYAKHGPIPKFDNISYLEAVFPSAFLQFLPAFLESFPNLKHLFLNFVYSEEMEAFELIIVPRCFLSTLECVEISGIWEWDKDEIKLASYFSENSSVLKKLRLSFIGYPLREPEANIDEELDKLTILSPSCQIIL